MEIKKSKNRGHITVFAVFVFAFVSWAVFSASFLISEELFTERDQRELEIKENKETFLEAVFLKNISEIENKILNEAGNKDIIWYFMKKGEKLLWTEKIYDFSIWRDSFNYAGFIENYSIPKKSNNAVIYFSKKINGVYAEGMEDEIYNIKISGEIHTRYFYEKKFSMEALTFCELKELKFEIYD